jgi:enoyl-CoA hydratase
MADSILKEQIGPTAIIRFNRPAERNPLSRSTLEELRTVFNHFTSQAHLKTIIITGTENVFASGANIRELMQLDSTSAREFSRLGQALCETIADARPLTVAAINGYCMGGALDLALACDIRVASSSAVFSHPGARLGIITGWGGTQRLPRIIGKARALEFLATARRCSAAEAFEMGLVSELGEDAVETALTLVGKVSPTQNREG